MKVSSSAHARRWLPVGVLKAGELFETKGGTFGVRLDSPGDYALFGATPTLGNYAALEVVALPANATVTLTQE
jgi:hypothetical protein